MLVPITFSCTKTLCQQKNVPVFVNTVDYEVSSSSPLLSLVTSTSEISHQPVHTYIHTYIQYDKGVDRTGRQGIEEIYSIHKVREEKKKKQPPDYAL